MNIKVDTKVTLVVFSCEGREHLLTQTIQSFENTINYHFATRLLALDGSIDNRTFSAINPDKVVQNYKRLGYIYNIINALSIIDTEFFFWLEDDWCFREKIDISPLIEILQNNHNWAQIRLSKTGPLTQEEKTRELYSDIFESVYGFSANPCLCRTDSIKKAFNALQGSSRAEQIGFEQFLSEWFSDRGMLCGVLDPGETAMVNHTGYLESTPRQWHMVASLDGKTDDYLSGMGHVASPSFWRKCWMFYKLTSAFIKISIRQFWSRAAYDLAFRISAISKEY